MNPRRVTFTISVPSTLAEDDEALQFFASAMWEEMLRRAGGIPAEESMVRAFIANDQFAYSELIHMVRVHIIGYAQPLEPEYLPEPPSTADQISALLGYIDNIYLRTPRQIPVFDSDSLISGLVDSELTLTGTFDSGWTAPESVSFRGRMYEDQISTTPQPEHWGDAMHYSPDDGGDVIL